MPHELTVLGLNTAHDAAACLLVGGRLVTAVGEERLSRVKHHEGFPFLAVDYCLREADLASLDDVDVVVVNEYVQTDFEAMLRRRGYEGDLLVNPSHHLLHAYYACLASGFDEPAVLVVDGAGYNYGEYVRRGSPLLGEPPPFSEMEEAESSYVATPSGLELVFKRWGLWDATMPTYRFPSLGHLFSSASQYIFGHMHHAGKTMGLSAYGDPGALPLPMVELTDTGVDVRTDWILDLPPRSTTPAGDDPVCRDLAARVQSELERAMLHLCRLLHDATGRPRLCLSGGVALNSVTNGRILRETPFRELFITPAAGDSGVAIGAALYGQHVRSGQMPVWTTQHDYLGRNYADDDVDKALVEVSDQVQARRTGNGVAEVADDLAAGRVVAWFEGGSEFGPRALGHRSILCDPRDPGMKDHLNALVKYREAFRPYAASVLTEHVPTFFDIPVADPYMLVVATVREGRRGDIPSVVHADGTCRVQAVSPAHEGSLRPLLEAFHRRTGMPMLLNTSFNIRGEPIVETPAEALECFLSSNLEVLYLQGMRVTKAVDDLDEPLGLQRTVPRVNAGVRVEVVHEPSGSGWRAKHYVVTRVGRHIPTSPGVCAVLTAVDGARTIAELSHQPGVAALGHETVLEVVKDLRRMGVLSFALAHHAGSAAPIHPLQ